MKNFPQAQQCTVVAYEAASLTALMAAINTDWQTRGGQIMSVDYECQNQLTTKVKDFIDTTVTNVQAAIEAYLASNPTYLLTSQSTFYNGNTTFINSICTFAVAASSGQYTALVTYLVN